MAVMNTTDHFIGDRVSVRCRLRNGTHRPGDTGASWLPGTVIARDRDRARESRESPNASRYVVQLDDSRRVVAFDDDVRRWTLCFDVLEVLEKMAS
jgi:hypothetical protein